MNWKLPALCLVVLLFAFVSCVTREELLKQGYTEEKGLLQNVFSKDNDYYYLKVSLNSIFNMKTNSS